MMTSRLLPSQLEDSFLGGEDVEAEMITRECSAYIYFLLDSIGVVVKSIGWEIE